ncbi:MAG: hypothetical protein DMG77_06275 [Acidobacteria bacterium]|nr:MAG: hypothetical protein DMG77_06275 [Acidobacteriota bacterium]
MRCGGQDLRPAVTSPKEFTDLVRKHSYDGVLADYKLPNWNGMESVEVIRREGLDIPVILDRARSESSPQ